MGFAIDFSIDLKDNNPFCDNLVLGFLLSEVKMNHRVLVNKEREKLGLRGTVPLPVTITGAHTQETLHAGGERPEPCPGRFYSFNCQNYAPTLIDCIYCCTWEIRKGGADGNLALQGVWSTFPISILYFRPAWPGRPTEVGAGGGGRCRKAGYSPWMGSALYRL